MLGLRAVLSRMRGGGGEEREEKISFTALLCVLFCFLFKQGGKSVFFVLTRGGVFLLQAFKVFFSYWHFSFGGGGIVFLGFTFLRVVLDSRVEEFLCKKQLFI